MDAKNEDGDDTCIMIMDGHSDRVVSIAFSPDGQYLASTSGDKTVKIWVVVTTLSDCGNLLSYLVLNKEEKECIYF